MTLNDEDRQKLNELHVALLGIKGTKDIGFVGETQATLDNHGKRIGRMERWSTLAIGGGAVVLFIVKIVWGH
jgi:hypothetical protein